MKNIEVACAVMEHKGKVFLAQRGYGEFRDYWEFPGGKLERGETAEDAVKREIREELQAEITLERKLGVYEMPYPDFYLRLHAYLCHLKGKMTLLEHEGSVWIDPKEYHRYALLPLDEEIIRSLTDPDQSALPH